MKKRPSTSAASSSLRRVRARPISKPKSSSSNSNNNIRNQLNILASMNKVPNSIVSQLSSRKKTTSAPAEVSVQAYEDRVDYTDLYRLEDKRFASRQDLAKFQDLFMKDSTISSRIRSLEYRWADIYFSPLTEFMGDRRLWAALGIEVPSQLKSSARSLGHRNVTPFHVAHYTGSHWVSRRKGTKEVFDPYNKVQIFGTNQFCQTFAMMYVLGALNYNSGTNNNNANKNSLVKYYNYTVKALDFIDDMIHRCETTPALRNLPIFQEHDTNFRNLKAAIRVCKAHPSMCLNIATLP